MRLLLLLYSDFNLSTPSEMKDETKELVLKLHDVPVSYVT
jgi:hypothetical protein